jgi:hypothetical protein
MSTKMTWEEACQILGVRPNASDDEIRSQYKYKANLLHPDKHTSSPPSVRDKAIEEFKRVGDAFDYLKNSRNRPNNNPPKLHATVSHVRFNVENGQTKNTTFKVNNTGGSYTSFWMDDSPAQWLKVVEAKSLSDTPLPIEVTLEATGVSVPKGHAECFLPIRIENEPTHAKDEIKLKIEMNLKTSSPGPLPSGTPSPSNIKSSGLPKIQKWIKALLLILGLSILGLGISLYVGNNISLWVLAGFSCIFSLEQWYKNLIIKFKVTHGLYKLLLNLSLLSLLGLLVWSGIKLFSHQYFKTALIGSFIFIGEFVVFVWIWKFTARRGSQWPSMKLTIFTLIALFFVFAFAGVSPFTEWKDAFLGIFKDNPEI